MQHRGDFAVVGAGSRTNLPSGPQRSRARRGSWRRWGAGGLGVALAWTLRGTALADAAGVGQGSSSSSSGAAPEPGGQPATDAADGSDVVELKDGTIVRGTVLVREPGRYVIVLGTGGAQTIPWQDVRRVVMSPSSQPTASPTSAPPEWGPPDAPPAWGPPEAAPTVPRLPPEPPSTPAPSPDRASMSEPVVRPDASVSSSWAGVSLGWDVRLEGNMLLKHYAISGGGSLWSGGPGAGGGVSVSLHFRTPAGVGDDARGTWLDFELGIGEAVHYDIYGDGIGRGITLFDSETPVIVGVHFATGTLSPTTAGGAWSGLALGLAWAPTFVELFGNGGFNSAGRSNPAGIRVTADVGAVRRADVGHVPMIRFVATWLPYVGALPTLFSVGIGCAFY
ncbi:MAG TPA: hypothetical protein VEK07_20160 [Polyangiaceae bacterium]|nr:hypothetical protein [Polyangiaceae bacterium]